MARYGGEEFVVLCCRLHNAAAARRAERAARTDREHAAAGAGRQGVTASFGVTEIQPGDTPETMLRRADRALLEAKGWAATWWCSWATVCVGSRRANRRGRPPGGELFVERLLVTAVPLNMAVEKLRGFVLDHDAEILAINADRIDLQIETCTRSSHAAAPIGPWRSWWS